MDKIEAAFRRFSDAADKAQVMNTAATLSALADAERALKRIVKRAAAAVEGFEDIELRQAHGPTLSFRGRLLANTEFEVQERGWGIGVRLEVWETEGGAMVAATYRDRQNPDEGPEIGATVVEPNDDHQTMRFEVMDAFDWSLRARSMLRKLGWGFRREVA